MDCTQSINCMYSFSKLSCRCQTASVCSISSLSACILQWKRRVWTVRDSDRAHAGMDHCSALCGLEKSPAPQNIANQIV